MRQHRWTAAPLVFTLALAAGCGRKDSAPAERSAMLDAPSAAPERAPAAMASRRPGAGLTGGVATEAAAPVPPATGVAIASPDPAAMLIRTATAAVEVKALDPAVAAARQAAQRNGGVVANANVETGRNEMHRAVLQIKVPAARFDSLLAGLAPLGRVESVAVSAQDVGEEFVDVEARLANLRRLETRLLDLLANRTGKLADVLSVEGELARVRGEIEQIEGRRRFLMSSVAVSTLVLTLHEPDPILAGTPGSNPIVVAVRDAWRNFVASIAWCITTLGVMVPVAAFLLGLGLLARWAWRRLRRAGLVGA